MTDSHEHRVQGIELGAVEAALAEHEFPTTADSIVAAHGDRPVGLPGETRTLEEVLPSAPDRTYATPGQARRSIIGHVGSAAVGRENYTDRDPPTPSREPDAPQSF